MSGEGFLLNTKFGKYAAVFMLWVKSSAWSEASDEIKAEDRANNPELADEFDFLDNCPTSFDCIKEMVDDETITMKQLKEFGHF